MHIEVLVEDVSGKALLDAILPRILEEQHTYRVIAYKGIGRIPQGLKPVSEARHRVLLDQLPRLIAGYGRSLAAYKSAALVVVVDADDSDCRELKNQMMQVLDRCNAKPRVLFRIAVEEVEAWLLGDIGSIKRVFPNAKQRTLNEYEQDSICGTWEVLADALVPGGAKKLTSGGYQAVGKAKSDWAKALGPVLDIDGNRSKSFQVFRDGLKSLAGQTA